jgi:hypothetical protein
VVYFVELPQLKPDFVWPSAAEIVELQEKFGVSGEINDESLQKNAKGQVLIPPEAKDLVLRLCVVAHNGITGHQGLENTMTLWRLIFGGQR